MNLIKYIGHDYERYNCFDLVKDFYADQYSIDLSNYFEGKVPDRRQVETLVVSNKGDFIKVDRPQAGDIVVIKFYGLECHIGVVVSPTMFLHSAKTIGSCMEKLSKYEKMIAGYYRHQERSSD